MAIEDDIAFYERVPTLGLLGRQALRILAIGTETRYVHSGEALFNAGEDADCAYVIQEGSLYLSSPAPDDGEGVTVGVGTLLGEIALLTETKRPVTATALEPSTVLRIPRSVFLKMLEGVPDAARKLRDTWAARTERATGEISGVRGILDAYDQK
jgi:CRP-like cAMP-binding protein